MGLAQPTYSVTLDNLYTTTWYNQKQEAIDNIFSSTPFWYILQQDGHLESQEGGTHIFQPLEVAKNTTVKGFSKGDTFSLIDPQILTQAKFDWKYIGGSIVRYFQDDQQNRGKNQILDLITTKINNLKQSIADTLETALHGDGSGDNGKLPDGLKKLIYTEAQAPASPGVDVVGGIDSYTNDWWRNQWADATDKPFSTYGIRMMRTMFNNCSNGADTPNLILTNQANYEDYEDELWEGYRTQDSRMANAGFESLTFKGKPVVWTPSCDAGFMYFLNMKYIRWVYDAFANFDMTDWKRSQNGLDSAAQVVVIGNLTISNRARQGVIVNIGVTSPSPD